MIPLAECEVSFSLVGKAFAASAVNGAAISESPDPWRLLSHGPRAGCPRVIRGRSPWTWPNVKGCCVSLTRRVGAIICRCNPVRMSHKLKSRRECMAIALGPKRDSATAGGRTLCVVRPLHLSLSTWRAERCQEVKTGEHSRNPPLVTMPRGGFLL